VAPDPRTPEGEHLIHHDNTFGTPEEDAFRRDFTINALFYDIATFSIIDYVGGLDDLRDRTVRSIGGVPSVTLKRLVSAFYPRFWGQPSERNHIHCALKRIEHWFASLTLGRRCE